MCESNDTQVLEKKLNGYGESDNFVAPRELTVTITLSEYRSLVMGKGVSNKTIDDLRRQTYKLEQTIRELVDELNRSKNDNKPEAEKYKDE
jgi:predicted nucleic acid-binding protein